MQDPGLFEIINTTRAIKRLKPDPVPLDLIRKVLDLFQQRTMPRGGLRERPPMARSWSP